MNYIAEINSFYDWLETNSVSDSAILLWQALMHVNNKSGWKEEFTVAISTLELKTSLSKSSILRARNTLQQFGRLTFRSRDGQQSAVYHMIAFHGDTQSGAQKHKPLKVARQTDTQTVTQTVTQSGAQTVTQTVPINKLNKTILNETSVPDGTGSADAAAPRSKKENTSEQPADPKEKSCAKKERGEPSPDHWSAIVDAWFLDYESRKGVKLSTADFDGAERGALKQLIPKVRNRVLQSTKTKDEPWTQENAVKFFKQFLDRAFRIPWYQDRWSLKKLNSSFGEIIDGKESTTNRTTAAVSGTSNGASVIPADRKYSSKWD